MKIVIVIVHHSLKRGGGGEQVIYDLIHGLDKKKFRPVLCCLYGLGELGEQLRTDGCRTYHNLIRTPYSLTTVFKVAAVLKKEHADILYVNDSFHNVIVGRLAAFLAKTPLSVIIFHTFDTIIRHGTAPVRRAMLELTDRLLHPHFKKVIALAESHKRYLIDAKRIPAEKIAVVHNGIDIKPFDSPADAHAVKHDLRLPQDAQVVGIVASLRRWKAHHVFLTAAASVMRKAPDTHFVIAGDGPRRNELEHMARSLGIIDHVHFLGIVRDIPRLLNAFDVTVLSSIHEAFPLVLLESMAAGLPVVATDVGSVAEIVHDGINGLLVPSGAADQMATAILRILQDPELARRFGQAGRGMVRHHFTVTNMVARCEALFGAWMNGLRRRQSRHWA